MDAGVERIRRLACGSATLVVVLATSATSAVPTEAKTAARWAVPAASSTANAGVLSTRPAPWTPRLVSEDSTVHALVPAGQLVIAVGSFSRVAGPLGHVFVRHNAFAFDAATGRVTAWAPDVNGTVAAAALSADRRSVFLAGSFTTVDGVRRDYLARVSSSTGRLDRRFRAHADRPALALVRRGRHLVVGGRFTSIGGVERAALASLDPVTGAAVGYLRLAVSGTLPSTPASSTRVVELALSHRGDRLLAAGNFTSVAGRSRRQVFMADLGDSGVRLDPWRSPAFMRPCVVPQYVRAVAWTPDDARVAVASTGFFGPSPLCDAAALFPSSRHSVRPLWVNRTGCDSLYATAATANVVYVGGHERWADNDGCDEQGRSAVPRPGIGAIGIRRGLATTWNPTRSRGHGADDMVLTAAGLWVASDNFYGATDCGHAYHPGICFFPYRPLP